MARLRAASEGAAAKIAAGFTSLRGSPRFAFTPYHYIDLIHSGAPATRALPLFFNFTAAALRRARLWHSKPSLVLHPLAQ